MTETPVLAAPADAPPEHPEPERNRRSPFSKRRVISWALLAAMVLGLLVYLLSWWSPVPVREVVVRGSIPETEAEILAAAAIRPGTPVRDVDADGAVARVQDLPGIDDTRVVFERPWTIAIEVVERFPFAARKSANGWTVLDMHGQPVRDVAKQPAGLPLVLVPPDKVGPVLESVSALPEDLTAKIAGIAYSDADGIVFTLRPKAIVRWGLPTESQAKARALTALLRFKAGSYNVSVPDRPALGGQVDLPKQNRESEPTEPPIP